MIPEGTSSSSTKAAAAAAAAAAVATSSTSLGMKIKRVVTCFILSTTTNNNNNNNLPITLSPPGENDKNGDDNIRIAMFHRCDTMPTFASHWAGISGSIEKIDENSYETPYDAVQREMEEETNLMELLQRTKQEHDDGESNTKEMIELPGGLYLDVLFGKSPNRQMIIRVYPFIITIPQSLEEKIKLRGTEHDRFQFVTLNEFLNWDEDKEPMVPGLKMAFHHATFGKYHTSKTMPQPILEWSYDKVNGAATLAKNAIQLLMKNPDNYKTNQFEYLRPTMVPIINTMKQIEQHQIQTQTSSSTTTTPQSILESLQTELQRSIDLGVQEILELIQQKHNQRKNKNKNENNDEFVIATFSRSSTLFRILQQVRDQHNNKNDNDNSNGKMALKIICSRSSPGDEGVYMAQDLQLDEKSCLVSDEELMHIVCGRDNNDDSSSSSSNNDPKNIKQQQQKQIDLLLVGADCIMPQNQIVINKIGTSKLAQAIMTTRCKRRCDDNVKTTTLPTTKIFCCADRYKLWEHDIYPPPIEKDLFEIISYKLFDKIIIPPPPLQAKPTQ